MKTITSLNKEVREKNAFFYVSKKILFQSEQNCLSEKTMTKWLNAYR